MSDEAIGAMGRENWSRLGEFELPIRIAKLFYLAMAAVLCSSVGPGHNYVYSQSEGFQAGERANSGEFQASADAGFHKLAGKFLELSSDLPPDEELKQLPLVFEKAMAVWTEVFQADPTEVQAWRAEAFVMVDKQRFVSQGLLPEFLPDFPYGFQYGDQLWVSEQPSEYYRRHLLLHEGTHWFMHRRYGASGPPWVMEGLAEWMGTHRWNPSTQQLEMGVIPSRREEVPYWGRIKRIQRQLNDGTAPSLEAIMRYGDTAHRQVDAYAWSWAAVLFMISHPETKSAFWEMLQQPMRTDLSQTRWLFGRLRDRWPMIRQSWEAFVTDLDYGFDVSPGLLQFSEQPRSLTQQAVSIDVAANRSWQGSGLIVTAGQRIRIDAEGKFIVGNHPRPWTCFPNGVTLEYHRGEPLGRLMMCVAAPQQNEQSTQPMQQIAVGSERAVAIEKSGELQFRINEASGQLHDNTGAISVSVRVIQDDRNSG